MAGTVAAAVRFIAKAALTGTFGMFLPKVSEEDVRGQLTGARGAAPAWLDRASPLSHIVGMPANILVRARIDEATKVEAAAVLAAMGLTVSDAFRMLLIRIAREKALPFEPLVPNEETIEAMRQARHG